MRPRTNPSPTIANALSENGALRKRETMHKHRIWLLELALTECLPFVSSYLGKESPVVKNARAALAPGEAK